MSSFPNLGAGRVDKPLTNVLLAYRSPQFIAGEMFPAVPNLKEESGLIGKVSNNHLRLVNSKRALYDESEHRMEFKYTQSDRYQIEYYDESIYTPDRLRDQLQTPFDIRRDASFVLQDVLSLEREQAIATAMTSTSILTQNTTLSGTSQYTDYANSDPRLNFEAARDSVFGLTGSEANAVLMSRKVANVLKGHPFFLDLAKRNAGMNVQNINSAQFVELLKSFFEVDYVYIGKTIKITSKEGQTETKANVWGNDVVFFHRAPSPSILRPSFGYSFALAGKDKAVKIRRHMNDKGDIVEVEWAYQDMILDVNCAYLIKDATA